MSELPSVIFGPEIWSLQIDGGISRYFQQLIAGLSNQGVNGKVLTQKNSNKRISSKDSGSFQVDSLKESKNPYTEISSLFKQYSDTFIYHPTYYTKNLHAIKNSKAKIVVTVFDLISELYPEKKSRIRKNINQKLISMQEADQILCISETTKRDLIQIYDIPKDKITVTYLGTNIGSVNKIKMTKLAQVPYLLYVGKRQGYKNFKNLVHAYSRSRDLKENFSLICVGGGEFAPFEISELRDLQIFDKVTRIDADDALLAMYYQNAACLVYPSLYEGFGLPPVEAMSLGCLVIASSGGSIPEICKDAAVYFDPSDPNSICGTILKSLSDEELKNSMRLKGFEVAETFTWEKTAAKTLNAYLNLTSP